MNDRLQKWKEKEITLDDVPSKICNGSKIYIGSCGSTAEASLQAMVEDWSLANIQILQVNNGAG